MSDQSRRLDKLETLYQGPSAWRVYVTERTSDGRLVELHTGEEVAPGPLDTVIVFGTYEGGPRQTTETPAT